MAIGTPGAPTPTGRFAVTDRLVTNDPAGPYGCCILALSANVAARDPGVDRRRPGSRSTRPLRPRASARPRATAACGDARRGAVAARPHPARNTDADQQLSGRRSRPSPDGVPGALFHRRNRLGSRKGPERTRRKERWHGQRAQGQACGVPVHRGRGAGRGDRAARGGQARRAPTPTSSRSRRASRDVEALRQGRQDQGGQGSRGRRPLRLRRAGAAGRRGQPRPVARRQGRGQVRPRRSSSRTSPSA